MITWTERRVAVDDLVPYEKNPRSISKTDFARLIASLQKFGYHQRVLAQPDLRIIGGHQRKKAFKQLGIDEVTVLVPDRELTDAEFRELLIKDNLPFGDFDFDMLANDFDRDLLKEWGMTDRMLGLVDNQTTIATGLSPDDDVPVVAAKPVSQPGDVWLLGDHRVMCGDSTNAEQLKKLMGGGVADLIFTSPPYSLQRDYETKIADWDKLMEGVFGNLPAGSKTQILVNLGLIHRENEFIVYWQHWLQFMREQNWRRFGWYVWDQGFGLPGSWNGRLGPSFEFIFHFNRESVMPNKFKEKKAENITVKNNSSMRDPNGKTTAFSNPEASLATHKIPDSVLRIPRQNGRIAADLDHPAPFPVALPLEIMLAYSQPKGMCYDPFLGSGSSIIAAEKSDRVCYGMELAPLYADVAVRRWQKFTAKDAILAGTESSFASVMKTRG